MPISRRWPDGRRIHRRLARRCGLPGMNIPREAASPSGATEDPGGQAVTGRALALSAVGALVGLGSARAVSAFIVRVGGCRRQGLRVSGVPTSRRSAELATRAGITLLELEDAMPLDL